MIESREALLNELAQAHRELQQTQARIYQLEIALLGTPHSQNRGDSDFNCAQETAQPSAQHYQDQIEDQTTVICRYRADFQLTFVNQSYSALYGMSPAEMAGLNLLALLPVAERERLCSKLLTLTAANPVISTESQVQLIDGTVHWFQWLHGVLLDDGGNVLEYQTVGRDITGQKNSQLDRDRYTHRQEELRQFLQATFDASSDHKAVLDQDGTIIYVNAPWRQFADANGAQSPTHYLGANYLRICDCAAGPFSAETELVSAGIRAVITGEQEQFWLEYPCHSPTKERWFALSVTPFAEVAPRRVVVAHQNITARVQAEKAERNQRHLAEALRDSVAALAASLDVDKVMRQILDSAETVVPSDASSIILFEGESGRVAYLRGFTPTAQAALQNYRFPLAQSAFGKVHTSKQPYWVADTQATPQWLSIPASSWIRSSIGIPIELKEEVIGVLVVDSATPHHFQQTDIAQLQTFAHYASLALANAYQTRVLEASVAERTAELQVANARVEAILNNSLDGIFLLGSDLHIQQTNPAFDTLFACPAGQCIGRTLLDLFPTEDQAQLEASIQSVRNAGIGKYLYMSAYRLDGTFFHAELSISALKERGLVCTIHDITERKQMEAALAEERNLLRTLIDAMPDFIWVKDRQHRFVIQNAATGHVLHSLWQEAVLGKTDFDLWPAERAAQFYADEEAIFQSGQPLLNHEEQVPDRDGHPIWLLSNKLPIRNLQGEITGLAGVTRDITEQKAHEQQLRFHASVQESVTAAVVTTDLAFHIQSWNRAAEAIYGWSAAEVMGRKVSEIVHSDFASPEELQESIHILLAQGWWKGEIMQHRRDGVALHILSSVTTLKDGQGHPVGIVAVNHDITASKQAQLALHESEARFRQLIEAAPVAIVISNPVGVITLVNGQAETLFGYRQDEIVGQPVDLLVPVYARGRHAGRRATYMAAPWVRQMGSGLEMFAQRKDGTEFPVDIQLSSIETQAGPLVMSFVVDITERKQIALYLEEQRTFLRQVIDSSPNLIFVKDSNARFVLVNSVLAQMYNTTPEGLVGKCDAEINPSTQEVEAFLAADRQVIASGEPFFIEEPVTSANGETRWFQTNKVPIASADGQVKYVLGVATDITERRKVEEDLRRSEQRLRMVLEHLPVGVWFIDANGVIQHNNPAGQAIWKGTKYVGIEAFGEYRAWWADSGQRLVPEEWAAARAIRKGEMSLNEEVEIEAFDGTHKYITNSAIPIRDGQYNIQGAIVVAQDITERKHNETLIRQALQKEKELNELKSRFVSMASHEFRTPLASISALSETLSAYRHRMTDAQIEQRLGKIQEQVGHLKDIMEDVLQLARLQARRTEFQPIQLDLDELCRGVIDEFQTAMPVQRTLYYSCDAALHSVKLDKKLIRQIFSNLLSNALKYSAQDKPITITLQQQDAVLLLSVKDQGIGIPAADLDHLFQPFHRATNVDTISGTGLGLTIAKESAELHGGVITVVSKLGVGTTFTVRVPLAS